MPGYERSVPTEATGGRTLQRLIRSPRVLGLWCAAAAVGLGIAYMAAAGAPPRYWALNTAALMLGVAAWFGLGSGAGSRLASHGWPVVLLALPLLATTIFGAPVEGASRWLTVGPLSVQISLVLLPAMIVLYARNPDGVGTAGIGLAALALAAQPDRAMAGVLAAATAAVAIGRFGWRTAIASSLALAAFAATMLQADGLPAVPFVDRILHTAFDVHVMAGAAVMAGCLTLVLPGFVRGFVGRGEPTALAAFGVTWASVSIAAAVGNYPTPLVGYGGSAVLGYMLSVALLPDRERKTRVMQAIARFRGRARRRSSPDPRAGPFDIAPIAGR